MQTRYDASVSLSPMFLGCKPLLPTAQWLLLASATGGPFFYLVRGSQPILFPRPKRKNRSRTKAVNLECYAGPGALNRREALPLSPPRPHWCQFEARPQVSLNLIPGGEKRGPKCILNQTERSLMETQWVQHMSGIGPKWEVEDFESDLWRTVKGTAGWGNRAFLPKSEYDLSPPPERWEEVTVNLGRPDGLQFTDIVSDQETIGTVRMREGYRVKSLVIERTVP